MRALLQRPSDRARRLSRIALIPLAEHWSTNCRRCRWKTDISPPLSPSRRRRRRPPTDCAENSIARWKRRENRARRPSARPRRSAPLPPRAIDRVGTVRGASEDHRLEGTAIPRIHILRADRQLHRDVVDEPGCRGFRSYPVVSQIADRERAHVIGKRLVGTCNAILRPFELRRAGIASIGDGSPVEVCERDLVCNGDVQIGRAPHSTQLARHALEREAALRVVPRYLAPEEIVAKAAAYDGRPDRRQDADDDQGHDHL